jgi:hypothetical protein
MVIGCQQLATRMPASRNPWFLDASSWLPGCQHEETLGAPGVEGMWARGIKYARRERREMHKEDKEMIQERLGSRDARKDRGCRAKTLKGLTPGEGHLLVGSGVALRIA